MRSRVQKIVLDGHGSFLGMQRGTFVVSNKDRKVECEFPLFESEIGEVVLRSGNCVSVGALASLGFWEIDVVILTRRGKPVAYLKSIDDDGHVETRIAQYQALENGKSIVIAKQIVLGKLEGQDLILKKYSLKPHNSFREEIEDIQLEDLKSLRKKLLNMEGRYTKEYFNKIFSLFPERIRPKVRKTFHAYDGTNNALNLAYSVLRWKCHNALVRAKLEPYLGFLHTVQYGHASLVSDFQDLYRYLIDDFLIQYCGKLRKKDFITKSEEITRKKKGKREYLNRLKTETML